MDALGNLGEGEREFLGEDALGERGMVLVLGLLDDGVAEVLSHESDLGALGVGVLVLLVLVPGGDNGEEDPEDVVVDGLYVAPDLDGGDLLLEHLAHGLSGGVDSVERGVEVGSLDLLDQHLDLHMGLLVVTL